MGARFSMFFQREDLEVGGTLDKGHRTANLWMRATRLAPHQDPNRVVPKPRPRQEPLLIELARLPQCSTPTGSTCGTTKGANTIYGAFTMNPKIALPALHQMGG